MGEALLAVMSVSADTHGADPQWLVLGGIFVGLVALCTGARSQFRLIPRFSLLQEYSVFLLAGVGIAQIWVHADPASLHATLESTLVVLTGGIEITPHFLVNDVFMVVFFAIAAKELSEAFMKPGGDLRGRKGIVPIIACVGGVAGPALIFVALAAPDRVNAWAVPCATDIAFAWLGARIIWGAKHPAVKFLLALAIADDFIGMIIIAAFYPQHTIQWWGFLILASGVIVAYAMRRSAHRSSMFRHWYVFLVPGVVCWLGLLYAGLHSALAFVFVVPFMPMTGRDEGIYAPEESEHQHDTVNQFEHHTKWFVDAGLLFFGLANAGVAWIGTSVWSQSSWAVFLGLGIGKPVGILLFTLIGYLLFVRRGPIISNPETGEIVGWRDVLVIGVLAGMGFTVALFVVDAAGGYADLRIGAMASFAYLILGVVLGKVLCARPRQPVELTPLNEPA